ncbi:MULTISPECIES: TlpA disulfide reductase family protein [unclassified Pseudodesulfovibrio]|uniref:TlpA family protein disulfide reductase n=1 Tax=unclassified Pseudodesulfovibrio TaxID=2661612 RepID=UPI000FEBAABD|nr:MULTISPECIES: TlpA disulfide reductase family protein [unclassified Pseudodesulfovibrio]MCJ2164528.1 TlpA family protein disulfide reductase [Pseudodesulfovibrio sp. S3-i]RWU04726.1 TlpA family protein disulfide reductase [Pseudodesulfovibrio sp. S3]
MKKMMLTLAACLLLATAPAMAADQFPDLVLKGQISPEHRAYLAAPEGEFSVADIRADFLLVEVFSMYCPICQREAPAVNRMFVEATASDKGERIRFIGIGVGNTPFEVEFYRKKYGVEFPIFEDPDYVVHKALGEIGTPAYYLVDLREGQREILFFHEGEIPDKDVFLKTVLDKTGR